MNNAGATQKERIGHESQTEHHDHQDEHQNQSKHPDLPSSE
jgi:hypothetical protein